jgi:hypothetical protein
MTSSATVSRAKNWLLIGAALIARL